MATIKFTKDGRTRDLDSRDKAGIVRAKYAGWVEQTEPAAKTADAPTSTPKASDTRS